MCSGSAHQTSSGTRKTNILPGPPPNPPRFRSQISRPRTSPASVSSYRTISPEAAVQAVCPHASARRPDPAEQRAPVHLNTTSREQGGHSLQMPPAPDTVLPSPLCSQVILGMGANATAVPNTTARAVSSPPTGAHILIGWGHSGDFSSKCPRAGEPTVGVRVVAAQSCRAAWSWWAAQALRPRISQHSG